MIGQIISACTLLVGFMASASVESDTIQSILTRKMYAKISDQVIETNSLNKLYSLKSYAPVWTTNQQINEKAMALRQMLLLAQRQGLSANDYWTPTLEQLYTSVNSRTWITFELAATDAYLRYAKHLSTGRVADPDTIDDDIKYAKKEFKDYQLLASAVDNPTTLIANVDQLAPHIEVYNRLKNLLPNLRLWAADGSMPTVEYPGVDLRIGQESDLIYQLKIRLSRLGYPVLSQTNVYDAEMFEAVKSFQTLNGIEPSGVIGRVTLKSLGLSANDRIKQVELGMEKLRWLPRDLESRYVFINLAFQELRVQENNQTVLQMRTVNGRTLRRSPSMRDILTVVELNPTWTVPYSIATKDKLPLLQKNPNYVNEHHFKLYDANSGEPVDPLSVDWALVTPKSFTYTLVQQPGRENALGVMKFPLTNPWSIYLHDTNEPQLMSDNNRLKSSGCIRLQDPLALGLYLLRDQPEWTESAIVNLLPQDDPNQQVQAELKIPLKHSVPLYSLYLTVDVNERGQTRFVDDYYGQDWRVRQALSNKRVKNEAF